ncbi:hypothetical protein AGR6A_pAt60160 [Agrobacterium sp. NCPPB 925]|nr:hypothetical protein AGR6A_pAt60160 [Agrobacterium sp. NCPPB 925]
MPLPIWLKVIIIFDLSLVLLCVFLYSYFTHRLAVEANGYGSFARSIGGTWVTWFDSKHPECPSWVIEKSVRLNRLFGLIGIVLFGVLFLVERYIASSFI